MHAVPAGCRSTTLSGQITFHYASRIIIGRIMSIMMLGEGEKTERERERGVDGNALSLLISVAFQRGVNGRAWPTRP
jgi:hypothetical protein